MMQMLRLDMLEMGTQTRVAMDEGVAMEYAELMRDGYEFPAIVVFFDGSKYYVADGFHRLLAAKLAGRKEIAAEIREGDRKAALRFGLSANAQHGLKRTDADKRRCIEIALMEFPELKQREIAALCHVSQGYVSKVLSNIPRNITATTLVSTDGRARPRQYRRKPDFVVRAVWARAENQERDELVRLFGALMEAHQHPASTAIAPFRPEAAG